jgi:CRISPR-associated protein Csb2
LEIEDRDEPPIALQPSAWTMPARRWATVTPVVFDRHRKGPEKWKQAEEVVATACERIGLPRPREVRLSAVSVFEGVPPGRGFPYLQRKRSGGNLNHTHAVMTFDEAVRGPVLLGAGRYRGYGLCRPHLRAVE